MLKLTPIKQARTYFPWKIAKDLKYMCETQKVRAQKIRGQWYVDVQSIIYNIRGKT